MAKGGLSKAFQVALARPVLNRLATIPIFQQGQELYLRQHLSNLVIEPEEAAANVKDGEVTLARLWMDDGFLQYECACERGGQGFLCAHGVAVALAAMEPKTAAGKSKPKTIDLAQTDKILREQPAEVLAGLLLGWAQQDERLQHHLMSFAAQQSGYAIDLRTYRASLKKRLKRPSRASSAAEFKKYAKSVVDELKQLEGMATQGQPYVAMELASDVVKLLFGFDSYDGAVHWVSALIPSALQVFVQGARQARAQPEVVVPHVLQFYREDMEAVREFSRDLDLEAIADLLGPAGEMMLARAAEEQIRPRRDGGWEERVVSVRMAKLAAGIYREANDFDGIERTILRYGIEDYEESLQFARDLMKAGQPERAAAFLTRVDEVDSRLSPPAVYWLQAAAHLQMKDVVGGFAALVPLLTRFDTKSFEQLHQFALDHHCWQEWRALLLSDRPPGDWDARDRLRWQFQLLMLEKDYVAAWPLAVENHLKLPLVCVCAMEMRGDDPLNAARVIAEECEFLVNDERLMRSALKYLDVAAELVIEAGVRPGNLSRILMDIKRRFRAHGIAYHLQSHELLWNKAIALLN